MIPVPFRSIRTLVSVISLLLMLLPAPSGAGITAYTEAVQKAKVDGVRKLEEKYNQIFLVIRNQENKELVVSQSI